MPGSDWVWMRWNHRSDPTWVWLPPDTPLAGAWIYVAGETASWAYTSAFLWPYAWFAGESEPRRLGP